MNKENRKKVEVIMRAIDKYQEVMVTSETQLIINGISIFSEIKIRYHLILIYFKYGALIC